jgi:MFS family permease
MGELPQPDVMDRAGRKRRLVLSFVVGAICAGAAFAIAHAVIPAADFDKPFEYFTRNMSAGGFVVWLTAITFGLAFVVTLAATSAVAKRKWQRERVPEAKATPK